MKYFVSALLIIVGIIHLLPLSGVLGADRLGRLYGMPFADANLLILMRHRAVLFGLLGLFLVLAAFRPTMQPAALTAGLGDFNVDGRLDLVLPYSDGGIGVRLGNDAGTFAGTAIYGTGSGVPAIGDIDGDG